MYMYSQAFISWGLIEADDMWVHAWNLEIERTINILWKESGTVYWKYIPNRKCKVKANGSYRVQFFCAQHSPWEAAEEKFGKLTKLSEELFPFA